MNLESEILKEHSKKQTVKIARWVGKDKSRFTELMELFLHGECRIAQRSAWIVSHCADNFPELLSPWLSKMIKKAEEENVHDAVKRNVVRVLQFVDIPLSLQGPAANLCFNFLQLLDAPIAVKTFSMTVLANIAKKQPGLRKEIMLIIEEMLPYSGAAIRSRGKKVLQQLSRYTIE